MPRKKVVDYKKLIKAVEAKAPSKELMTEFGFKTSAQLKVHYLDALIAEGQAPPIVTKRGRSAALSMEDETVVKVTKRGSISVPKDLIEEMGYEEGDGFVVRKTKAGMILKQL